MLVGVYLDTRRSSTTSKYAESGNYEAFVMVLYQFGARVCDVNRGEGQGWNGCRWPSRGEEKRKSII